jgi:hypothetical protein
MVADSLEAAGHEDHPQAPFPLLVVTAEVEHVLDDATVGPVDQLVELHQRLSARKIAVDERVERNPDHLLGPRAHLVEDLGQRLVALELVDQLRQLGDRDAVVGGSLEVQVDVQDREREAQVDRNGRLPRQQRLDPLLDAEVDPVDVVVERDYLVGELGVSPPQRVDRAAERAQNQLPFLEQRRLERVQLFLKIDPRYPNRPVT